VHHTGTGLDWTGTVHCLPGRLREPLSWRRPRMVFLNSMSDVGHDAVSDVFLAAMWTTMFWTSHEVSGGSRQRPGTPPVHTYQILTKRPARLRTWLRRWSDPGQRTAMLTDAAARGWAGKDDVAMAPGMPPVLPNVWLGTSIETDDYTHRADHLRRAPVPRFLSLEPLLGPLPSLDLTGIDWVIVGGESGPGHRTLDLNWVRDLRDRAARQDIAFFFKQVGGLTPKAGGRTLDGRTWDQMPGGDR
jgi:protein gp37